MKEIKVPKKTFEFYVDGERSFIHLPKTPENEYLLTISLGEKVRLVNAETGESLEQKFMILGKFNFIPRFHFLFFELEKKSNLHLARKIHYAKYKYDNGGMVEKYYRSSLWMGRDQEYIWSLLASLTAHVFIEDSERNHFVKGSVLELHERGARFGKLYTVTNILSLKKDILPGSGLMYVLSLIPHDLYYAWDNY